MFPRCRGNYANEALLAYRTVTVGFSVVVAVGVCNAAAALPLIRLAGVVRAKVYVEARK